MKQYLRSILFLLISASSLFAADSGPVFDDFLLEGRREGGALSFTLSGTLHPARTEEGRLRVLSGSVALEALPDKEAGYAIEYRDGGYDLVFKKKRSFWRSSKSLPVSLTFRPAVAEEGDWSATRFELVDAPMRTIRLHGFPEQSELAMEGASRPRWEQGSFLSNLPPDKPFELAWREAADESEGRLFFAAEEVGELRVSAGLLHQQHELRFRVVQGKLEALELALIGEGELMEVSGPQVLSWEVVGSGEARRLKVRLNQAVEDALQLTVSVQQSLPAFPHAFEPLRFQPEGAMSYGGHWRIAPRGSVKLDVGEVKGFSQIAPERFPGRSGVPAAMTFRHSGGTYALRLAAEDVEAEVTVSELIRWELGRTGQRIEAEFELEIREAPLRDWSVRLPAGFNLMRVDAQGLADYNLREDGEDQRLQLLFGKPVHGRLLVQLVLEANARALPERWLPGRIEPIGARAVRGQVGFSVEPGIRLVQARHPGLSEMAASFFPKASENLQFAYRLREVSWQAAFVVESLPQSVQVDALHLFTLGEGIAYGSSVLRYEVSGAPLDTLKLSLPQRYGNVEFTGPGLRGWKRDGQVYELSLNRPTSGSFLLLATYELPFERREDVLHFSGAEPLSVNSEEGYVVVASNFPLRIEEVELGAGLLPVKASELPADYALFIGNPVVASYRFTARPMTIGLKLTPYGQVGTMDQVVDFAELETELAGTGEVLTTATYLVKTKGLQHFPLELPEGARLWSVEVDGQTVVPVQGEKQVLIPVSGGVEGEARQIRLKLASRAADAARATLATPKVGAPVLMTDWLVKADAGKGLRFLGGDLSPRQVVRSRQIDYTGEIGLGVAFGLVVVAAFIARFLGGRLLFRLLAAAIVVSGMATLYLTYELVRPAAPEVVESLNFSAPLVAKETMLRIEVANTAAALSVPYTAGWPSLAGLLLVLAGALAKPSRLLRAAGWVLIVYGAYRLESHWPGLYLLACLLLFAAEGLLSSFRGPGSPPLANAAALVLGLLLLPLAGPAGKLNASKQMRTNTLQQADGSWCSPEALVVLLDRCEQAVRVEEDRAEVRLQAVWEAERGDVLYLLREDAVLLEVDLPEGVHFADEATYKLEASEDGRYDLALRYEVPVARQGSLYLPTAAALIQRVALEVDRADLAFRIDELVAYDEVPATQAGHSAVEIVTGPTYGLSIGWKPRSRDLKEEETVFFSEIEQVFVPLSGVIEGWHRVRVKPSRGLVRQLEIAVPAGLAVTRVQGADAWRFDPDAGLLRLTFEDGRKESFDLGIRTQAASGALPYETTIGPLSLRGSAGEVGLLGLATGDAVQLDGIEVEQLSAVSPDDFPDALTVAVAREVPSLKLRRAWRYRQAQAQLTLKASAVQPDIRVVSQQTLSVGEDRLLLASQLEVEISRAGIFKLVLPLPEGLDVESVSGEGLSHWTESEREGERRLTLHLLGRTLGERCYQLSLTAPGLRDRQQLEVPRLLVESASKQSGRLSVVPEQGYRLHVSEREGLTQLDPKELGFRDRGAQVFRLFSGAWKLAFEIEKVDPWIEVLSLQEVLVGEGGLEVNLRADVGIENAGVRALQLLLPEEAVSVQVEGSEVGDYRPDEGEAPEGYRSWVLPFKKRLIGSERLEIRYQLLRAEGATAMDVLGARFPGVDLSRGFLSLSAEGRLDFSVEGQSELQPTEWQAVPSGLRAAGSETAARRVYRLIDPAFRLPLSLVRREAAEVLPARVESVRLESVVAEAGHLLTRAELKLQPGSKRLLRVRLPEGAQFWFAFVNGQSAWTWTDGEDRLIPLEENSLAGQSTRVEFVYLSTSRSKGGALEGSLEGPRFDLPLEDISWSIAFPQDWELQAFSGSLEHQEEAEQVLRSMVRKDYLKVEAKRKKETFAQAESLFLAGNRAFESGDNVGARRAFESAYQLSRNDAAFNEDARVQLQNVMRQQALYGLANNLNPSQESVELNFTNEDLDQVLGEIDAEASETLDRLARRLIEQHQGALTRPSAIRAVLPQKGRQFHFKRALLVDPQAALTVDFEGERLESEESTRWILAATAGTGLLLLLVLAPRRRKS